VNRTLAEIGLRLDNIIVLLSKRYWPNFKQTVVLGVKALLLDTIFAPFAGIVRCAMAYTRWLQNSLRFVHMAARRHVGAKLRGQKQYLDSRISKQKFRIADLDL
jgi:hypothetical protein